MNEFVFRKIHPEDLDMLLEWRTHPRIQKYLSVIEKDISKQRDWLDKMSKDSSQQYRIVLSKNEYLAVFSFNGIDYRHSRLEIGGYVIPEKLGKLHRVILKWYKCIQHLVFEHMKFNRIVACIPVFNKPSLHLHRLMGFKQEGIMRQWVFHEGKFHDGCMMSFIKDDWIDRDCCEYEYEE